VERLLRDAGARRLADWLKRAAQKHLTQEAVSLPPRKVVRMARALERQR